jgi:L-threonylcarbamoyladenylate synthase
MHRHAQADTRPDQYHTGHEQAGQDMRDSSHMNDLSSTADRAAPHGSLATVLRDDADGIEEAARLLRAGKLVALPTETVYGLAADGSDPMATAAIYAAKGRPSFNPLIAHLHDIAAARKQGLFSAQALALAGAFWPGPLTLVVPISPGCSVCELARAGLPTIGLRVPAHAATLDVLERVDRPVVAPSANRSGHVSPTNAGHVLADLGGMIEAVLDAGPCPVGVESTIIACLGGA